MGAWSWTKRVILDHTGGVEPIPVELERNPGAVVELGAENPEDVPLYLLRVGLEGGFAGGRAGLPTFRRANPSQHPILKEIYWCEVAGKTLEAANIYALRDKVQRQLEVLAPSRTLPLCYFRAPRYDYSLAVYEDDDRLVCPVLAGPKIKAKGLAEIREPVVRHLKTAGYLMPDEEPQVLVVRPSDLRLVPPAGVIRSLDDSALWIPAVEGSSEEGPVVGLLTHPPELAASRRSRRGRIAQEPPPSAPEITALLRYISQELALEGRLPNPGALYACEVQPEIWARTQVLTDPTDRTLTCHLAEGGGELEIPVRRTAAGESVGAIREREISVFLTGDDDALSDSIGRYLVASGFLRDAADLRAEAIPEAPAEALDPGEIWTSAEISFGTQPSTDVKNEDLEVETT